MYVLVVWSLQLALTWLPVQVPEGARLLVPGDRPRRRGRRGPQGPGGGGSAEGAGASGRRVCTYVAFLTRPFEQVGLCSCILRSKCTDGLYLCMIYSKYTEITKQSPR